MSYGSIPFGRTYAPRQQLNERTPREHKGTTAMSSMFLAITAILALTVTSTQANCSNPLPPSNGLVSPETGQFTPGNIVRVFCRPHYKFDGTNETMRVIRCLPGGVWESYPQCRATITCSTPPPKAGGTWILTGRGPGDRHSHTRARANFQCNPGHIFAGPRNNSVSQARMQDLVWYCNNDLQWAGRWIRRMNMPGYRCLAEADCNSDPGDITHGSRTGSCCANNNAITYSCDNGYHLIGRKTITCINRKWNTKPYCSASRVCTKHDLAIGTLVEYPLESDKFEPGTTAWFFCEHGYFFRRIETEVTSDDSYDYGASATQTKVTFDTGNRSLDCTGSRWSGGPTPACNHVFTCPVRTVTNGQWNTNQPRIKHGEAVTITCNPGYIELGPASIKCSIDKANDKDGWNLDPPSCRQIRCARPVRPERGIVSLKNGTDIRAIGAVIEISCNHNFELDGSSIRKCMTNGRWSGNDATCQPTRAQDISHCPVPVKPYGGRKFGSSYNKGNVVTYECHNDHISRGPSRIVCSDAGQWKPVGLPRCEALFSFDDREQLAGNFGQVLDAMVKSDEYDPIRGRRIELNAPEGLDITFLIDSSGSITQKDFNDSIEFVKLFVEKLGVSEKSNGARIGVASFAAEPEREFHENNGFNANPPKSVELVKNLLDNLKYQSGDTNITGALAHFKSNMLPLNLEKREKAKQYLFILSDGDYNRGGSPVLIAEKLRKGENEVEIFSVKIGSDKETAEAKKNTLVLIEMSSEKEMNGAGTDPHFFHLQDYATFDYMVQELLNGSIDYSECGVAGKTGITLGNIIGGNLAQPRAWPWMAAIMASQADNLEFKHHKQICGGTVLNGEWILTAAHCFQGDTYNNIKRVVVKLGTNNMKQFQESNPINVQDVRVRSMHIHQEWIVDAVDKKKYDNDYANDIALLRLARKISFSNRIRPICLIPKTTPNKGITNKIAVVTGWGRPGNESLPADQRSEKLRSDELRQVRLPVVTQEEDPRRCINRYPKEKVICAGWKNKVMDSCWGDSGGPLMIELGTENNKPHWNQIGIVSNGIGCAQVDGLTDAAYGRYTDVRQYRDWIDATIQNAGA